jgi:hypothetical protein
MSKFAEVSAALERLPEALREGIAEILETHLHGDLHPETALNDVQVADLRARLANPGPLASDAEVEDSFKRFSACPHLRRRWELEALAIPRRRAKLA